MPRRLSFVAGIVLFLPLLQLIGCRRTVDNTVLARIGQKKIRVEDLRWFKIAMPALLRSGKEGIEEWRDYLQTMIDMELMLREVRRQGIDRDPGVLKKWEEERRKKLVEEYMNREISAKIDMPAEELRRRFHESKWSRMLQLARIRVKTEEDAERVVRELKKGRLFEEVAGEWSIDHKTVLDPFYGRGNLKYLGMPVSIAEELFVLKVGEVSRLFQMGDGYEIFKVVEERPAPGWYGEVFARVTLSEEVDKRRKEMMPELIGRFDAQVDHGGVAYLIERAARSNGGVLQLLEQEQRMTLCRFRGGELTLKDFVDTYKTVRFFQPVTFDRSGMTEFINQYLLPDALMFQAALQEGIDRDDSVAAWLATKKEAMLLDTLREREVERRIILSDEAIRRYYETHTDRFMQPEEIQVIEILVATEEEARNLLRRIQKGEAPETLAVRYSIRQGTKSNKGRFHMHPFEQPIFGALLDEAMEAEVGQLRGPVRVKDGYSVFKVVEKVGQKPEPFEKAVSRARYWLKKEEESRLSEELILKLRKDYASQVVVFEDRLKVMDEK